MTAQSTLSVVAVSALMVVSLFATSAAGGPLEDAGVLPISDENCSSVPNAPLCEEAAANANENLTTLDGVLDTPGSAINDACSTVGGADVDNCTALLGAAPDTVAGALDGICGEIGGEDVDDCDSLSGSVGPDTAIDLIKDLIGNNVTFDDFTATPVVTTGFELTGSVDGTVPQTLNGTATVTKPDASTEEIPFTWVDDDNVIEPPADNDGALFAIAYTASEPGTYTFTFEVDNEDLQDQFFEANDTIQVEVIPVVGGDSVITVTVTDTDTVFTFDPTNFVGPIAGTASSTSINTSLQDDNGWEDVDAAGMTVVVRQPGDIAEEPDVTDADPVNDTQTFTRTYTNDIDFPAHLKDGSYEVNATTTGATGSHVFSVANVAPTVASHGQSGSGLEEVGDQFAGNFTVNDDNWGTIGSETVTELAAADIRVVDSLGEPATGFALQIAADGDALVSGSSVDLSGIALDGSSQEIDFEISYADNAALPGGYTLQAQATDDNSATSNWEDVYSFDIIPANLGFFMDVDDTFGDGQAGIAMGDVAPGEAGSSSDDPVNVTISGTEDAASLFLIVADFVDGSNTIESDGMTVKVYGNEDLSDTPTTGTVADGDVTVPLGALGAAGGSVYVVFEQEIPLGTPAGTYSANVDFIGVPA